MIDSHSYPPRRSIVVHESSGSEGCSVRSSLSDDGDEDITDIKLAGHLTQGMIKQTQVSDGYGPYVYE